MTTSQLNAAGQDDIGPSATNSRAYLRSRARSAQYGNVRRAARKWAQPVGRRASPFLRADLPAVAAKVGLAGKPAAQVFAEIRERKNRS